MQRLSIVCRSRRVVMERTPNPRTFLFTPKFETKKFPTPKQFEKSIQPHESAMAAKILDLPGVERVLFFSPNAASVTVSAEGFADHEFQKKIADWLANDLNAFDAEADGTAAPASTSEVVAAIQEVLDFRIKPSVQADGGDVEIVDYNPATKTVTVRMRGACVGCPSSEQTLRGSIAETLKFYVPNDVAVVECVGEEGEGGAGDGVIRHNHEGEILSVEMKRKIQHEFACVSLFATKPVDAKMKERINFASFVDIKQKSVTPDLMVNIKCEQCGAHKGIEALDSLLVNQPQQSGKAAVMVCPVCVVVLSLVD